MSGTKFSLTVRGLINASTIPVEEDFAFIVGKKTYKCNRVFAGFISPIISRILKTDPNANSFDVQVEDDSNLFRDVMNLMHGAEVPINEKNSTFLIRVGRLLGNQELIECTRSIIDETPTLQNCVSLLKSRFVLDLPIERTISFIARNFSDISLDNLKTIEPSLLLEILLCTELLIDDEEWLLNFIVTLITEKGDKYCCLLATVQLEYLFELDLKKFLSYVRVDDINHIMWESIQKRLLNPTVDLKTRPKRYKTHFEHFALKEPLNGILQYLMTGKTFPNFPFNISVSSFDEQKDRIISRSPDTRWQSADKPNSYVIFDFNKQKVRLNNYVIRTYKIKAGSEGFHMKSWKLLGSVNGDDWVTLDVKTNTDCLNGVCYMATMKIDSQQWFRYIKIMMTDKNHANTWHMTINDVEFFGDLSDAKDEPRIKST